MSDWNQATLGEVSDSVSYGYTESASSEKIGPKFLRITDIQGGVVDWEDVPYCPINEKDFEKYKLEKGDIVVARTGNSTGENYLFSSDEEAVYASYLIKFSIKAGYSSKYIWYSMRSPNWWGFIEGNKTGSAQAGANAKTLSNFEINLPPLSEQKAIAHILGTLDDKIELNRQMNQTLEAMAQALFKSWFVDFDPVIDNALAADNQIPEALQARAEKRKALLDRHSALDAESPQKGAPLFYSNPALAALFPSSFEYTEALDKWIPAGWEVKSVGDVSEVISKGTTPRKDDVEGKPETIPFIKVRDIDDSGDISQELDLIPEDVHLKQLKRSILRTGDILFSIAGTIGRVAIVNDRLENSNCNQAVAFVRMKNKSKHLIIAHQNMKSVFVQSLIDSKVVQAVQANASLKNISEIPLVLPNDEIIIAFNKEMEPMYRRSSESKEQISTLIQLRDTLLPQLISGKVRVPEEVIEQMN